MLNAGVQAGCPMSEIMTTTPTRQWQAQAMMLDKKLGNRRSVHPHPHRAG